MRRRLGGIRTRKQKVLCGRLDSLKKLDLSTTDEIINCLCSKYPEYKREKRHVLINLVQDSLDLLARGPKQYKRDTKYQDPQWKEEISDDDGDGDDGVVSEGSEKVEPQFDLTMSMLRASYAVCNNKEEEDDLELELSVRGGGDGEEAGFVKLRKEDEGGPRFKDLGGIKKVLEELEMKVFVLLYHHKVLGCLGVRPISGLLLHGPPGCGKTKLAHAIANETGFPFYEISSTELVSGVSGDSEKNIRELFQKAHKTAPSIIFIDEIDAIASKRESLQREMERRIVTQLMTCMEANSKSLRSGHDHDDRYGYVLVIGATNRPNSVDPALRRPGRFDYEIELGVPDEKARLEILSVLARAKKISGCFDLVKIARSTPGFVAADLDVLINEAGYLAVRRTCNERKTKFCGNSVDEEQSDEWLKEPLSSEEMEKISITMSDIEEAIRIVQPSTKREGFSTIPTEKWEDVGGLDLLRNELDRHIVKRIKDPARYERFGVDLEMGFLLYGPPGCGKTKIAKAIANEAGANFIHIKGPELLSKYVGESELSVRTLFGRAKTCPPCIIFFDEVDALTSKRDKEGSWMVERLLTQLLVELDGADQRRGVFVIGATNRPEEIDKALLRPGRFGKLLYVPLPAPEDRSLILKALARNKPVDQSVDLDAIGRKESCDNFSGADLAALMNEASTAAAEDYETESIKTTHFERSMSKISPSVKLEQRRYYRKLAERFQATT